MEAFRAHALDLASVADIPPIFANWTGLKVHIVAAKYRSHTVQSAAAWRQKARSSAV